MPEYLGFGIDLAVGGMVTVKLSNFIVGSCQPMALSAAATFLVLVVGLLLWWVVASKKRLEMERARIGAEIQTLKAALAQNGVAQTAELRQSEAQIRELNAELEQRVFERTTALAATNKRLQHDITERKRVERALRESEGRFRSLAASSPLGIFQTDLDGRCLYANEQWQKIADFSLEESLGKGWVNAIHPEDRRSVLEEWAECTQARREFSREFRFLTHHGHVRWVHSYAAAIVSRGEITGYVGTTEDVTEWKMAEERFRVLFEFSSDAHLLTDGGAVIDCNHAAAALLRCQSKGELLAMRPGSWWPDTQPDGQRSGEKYLEMERLARERGSHRFEWTHRKTNGEEFVAEVGLTPVTINDRPALLTVWHDLTERKQAEAELRKFAGRLEENNRELKQALANVKTLRGLLPICSGCKKIRDDRGYWNQIEFFIRDHSDANFSHGMCPECAREYFPGLPAGVRQEA
jgi:PAS domain S-box-containing protein